MNTQFNFKFLTVFCFSLLLGACGGGSPSPVPPPPPPPPPLENQAPVANAGDAQTVDEQTLVTLQGIGTDSDGSVTGFSWTQTSGSVVTLTNANSAQSSFTAPTLTQQQTLTFSFTITDDDGATHTDTVSVTVSPVNTTPIANAGEQQSVDAATLVTLVGSGTDSDGSISGYSWAQTSGTTVTLNNSSTKTATFMAPQVAQNETLVFNLTVTDNEGATASNSVAITVNKPNVLPVANAGADQSVYKSVSVTLAGAGSDEDGSINAYLWTQTSGTTVALNDANTAMAQFTSPASTEIESLGFTLTVTDNAGASSDDAVTVIVSPFNNAPAVEVSSDKTVNKNSYVRLNGSGSDDDGYIANYHWQQLSGTPVTLIDSDSTQAKFWAPDAQTDETLVFQLTTVDDKGATNSAQVSVAVLASDLFNDIQFVDSILESCLRWNNAINSTTTASQITNLSCGGSVEPAFTSIGDLTGLEQLTNLASVSFYLHAFDSIMPLSKLVNLKSLSISVGTIDLSPLGQLTALDGMWLRQVSQSSFNTLPAIPSLTRLSMSNTKLTDITPLGAQTGLTEVNLSNNYISDITPLAKLKSLTSLQLSDNLIVDIIVQKAFNSQTVDFSHVLELDLSGNAIQSTASLASANFSGLTKLNLGENPLTDLSGLVNLSKLTDVVLSNSQLTDLSPVLALGGLETVNLKNNTQLSCDEIDQFKTQTSAQVSDNCNNIPPVVDAHDDLSVDEETSVTVTLTTSDSDGSISSFWVKPTTEPIAYLRVNVGGSTFTIKTPSVTQQKTLGFEVTVIDNEGAIATDTMNITVNPVNIAPIANAGEDQGADGQQHVVLPGNATDEDGSISSYQWSQVSGDTVILNNSHFANANFVSPVLSQPQTLVFSLSATDNEGAVHSDEVSVIVGSLDDSIIADAGTNQTVIEQTEVTLSAEGSRADNSISSYQWSQVAGPTVTLNNAHNVTTTFTAPAVLTPQKLSFMVLVTDSQSHTESDLVDIIVAAANNAPTVNAGQDKSVYTNSEISLNGEAIDTDGTINTTKWVQTGGTKVQLSNPWSLTPTFISPEVTTQKTLAFTLTVTDNEGASASDEVLITILANQRIENVNLNDNFKSCILQAAQANGWATTNEVTKLDCSNKNISSLAGIKHFRALTELNVSGNTLSKIWDLNSIEFNALTTLDFSNNQIDDTQYLDRFIMPVLNSLSLNGNKITKLTQLRISSLPKLQTIHLQDNPLNDISELQWFTPLTSLNISNTQVTDIVPLFGLPALKSVDLTGNTITCQLMAIAQQKLPQTTFTEPQNCTTNQALISSITFKDSALNTCISAQAQANGWTTIEQMTRLTCENAGVVDMDGLHNLSAITELNIKGNNINHLNALIYLKHLSVLDLSYNKVDDINLLASLSKLTHTINLSNNQISDVTAIFDLNVTSLNLSNNDKITCGQFNGIAARLGEGLTKTETCDASVVGGRLSWKFSIPGEYSGTPAIGSDGTLYIASTDDNLYALNPDGSKKWATPIPKPATASISPAGTIYVSSRDGNFYALNNDGSIAWAVKHWQGRVYTPAIATDGTVYVDNNESLFALNSDGSLKWQYSKGDQYIGIHINSTGMLYLATGKVIRALTANGEDVWTVASEATSLSIDAHDNLFAVDLQNTRAFDSSGNSILYNYDEGWFNAGQPLIDWNNNVYIPRYSGGVLKVDSSLQVTSLIGSSEYVSGTGAISENGIYYLPQNNFSVGDKSPGLLVAHDLNNTGAGWSFESKKNIYNSPVVGDDGTVYFNDASGVIFALQGNGGPLASGGWARQNKDNANTKNAAN